MKIFSLYDMKPGDDRRSFLEDKETLDAAPSAFASARVQFLDREERTEPDTVASGELMIVVMQGRCRICVHEVEHPVRAFDVVLLHTGDTWSVSADDVDPAVLFFVSSPRES